MAKISKEIIKNISQLIRIHVPDSELDNYKSQLETALDPARDFKDLDTEGVEITAQTIDLENIFREDDPEEGLSQEEALMNVKDTYEGYIIVKRVINEE